MKWHYLAAAMLIAPLSAAAFAQPADLPIPAAVSDQLPPGISIAKTKSGQVYVDAKGHTLYGLDLRALVSRTANGAKYCQGPCLAEWEPVLAPAGSKPDMSIGANPLQNLGGGGGGQGAGGQAAGQAQQGLAGYNITGASAGQGQAGAQGLGGGGNRTGVSTGVQGPVSDWSIADGPNGPQYVYKRWHMVYIHKGDKPGRTDKDGADTYAWNTLKYVAPAPKLVAPTTVASTLRDGGYVLTDKDGRVLFTGKCASDCRWAPLQAGAAGRGLGEWTVDRSGDTPQWVYRGKPVFVSQEDDPLQAPAAGTILRP